MLDVRNDFGAIAEDLMGDTIYHIDLDGRETWTKDGKPHRDDGPAVIWRDGYKWWFQYGKRHRVDGPAYEGKDGVKIWYLNDLKHCTTGPAVDYANGKLEWWVDGEQVPCDTQEEFLRMMKLRPFW